MPNSSLNQENHRKQSSLTILTNQENNQQFLYQGNEPSLKILTNQTITNISYIRRTISQNTNKSEDPSLTVLKIQENHN